jgi:hypothetical protein
MLAQRQPLVIFHLSLENVTGLGQADKDLVVNPVTFTEY